MVEPGMTATPVQVNPLDALKQRMGSLGTDIQAGAEQAANEWLSPNPMDAPAPTGLASDVGRFTLHGYNTEQDKDPENFPYWDGSMNVYDQEVANSIKNDLVNGKGLAAPGSDSFYYMANQISDMRRRSPDVYQDLLNDPEFQLQAPLDLLVEINNRTSPQTRVGETIGEKVKGFEDWKTKKNLELEYDRNKDVFDTEAAKGGYQPSREFYDSYDKLQTLEQQLGGTPKRMGWEERGALEVANAGSKLVKFLSDRMNELKTSEQAREDLAADVVPGGKAIQRRNDAIEAELEGTYKYR